MLILGLDAETTGLDLVNDRITELGLVMWDSESKQPVRIGGFLINTPKEITEEITKLTGITRAMLDKYGVNEKQAFETTISSLNGADYIIAHNGADFDKVLLENWASRENTALPVKTWIDSKSDLPAEAYGRSASLKYMACDHGFLYDAHRAVSDVLAMLKILSLYDVDKVVERAKQPTVYIQALVTFDNNKLAKERGYHWKPETKQWIKPIKQNELEQEQKEAGFKLKVVEKSW